MRNLEILDRLLHLYILGASETVCEREMRECMCLHLSSDYRKSQYSCSTATAPYFCCRRGRVLWSNFCLVDFFLYAPEKVFGPEELGFALS